MLRIDQLRLLPGEPEAALLSKCARLLRVEPSVLTDLTVLRRAIDAREGLTFVYTVAVSAPQEAALLRRCRDKRVTAYAPERYALPAPVAAPEVRPIVVGAGPAGLFAALVLARAGAAAHPAGAGPAAWSSGSADVERFWSTGELDTESNVQFGEGGAGAFSDGKLNTGTQGRAAPLHPGGSWSRCGAPEDILIDAQAPCGHRLAPHRPASTCGGSCWSLGADIRFGSTPGAT